MPYSCLASAASAIGSCTCTATPNDCKLAHDVDDLGIARVRHVLLERQAEHRDTLGPMRLPRQQPAHAFARNALAHAVVDAPAGQDDLRMIAGLLGAMRQVIGIDADAVAADQARA